MKDSISDKGFLHWYIKFGLFWFVVVYGILKIFGIYRNGFDHELQLSLLAKECVIGLLEALLISWLVWKFVVTKKS